MHVSWDLLCGPQQWETMQSCRKDLELRESIAREHPLQWPVRAGRDLWMVKKLDHGEASFPQWVNRSFTEGFMPGESVEGWWGEDASWRGSRRLYGKNIPEVAVCTVMWNHKISQHILRITSASQLLHLQNIREKVRQQKGSYTYEGIRFFSGGNGPPMELGNKPLRIWTKLWTDSSNWCAHRYKCAYNFRGSTEAWGVRTSTPWLWTPQTHCYNSNGSETVRCSL